MSDAHVWAYLWHLPSIVHGKQIDKIWKAFEAEKMSEDQALVACDRADQKLFAAYLKKGYDLRPGSADIICDELCIGTDISNLKPVIFSP